MWTESVFIFCLNVKSIPKRYACQLDILVTILCYPLHFCSQKVMESKGVYLYFCLAAVKPMYPLIGKQDDICPDIYFRIDNILKQIIREKTERI